MTRRRLGGPLANGDPGWGPPLAGATPAGGSARPCRPSHKLRRKSGVGGHVPAPLPLGGPGRPLLSIPRLGARQQPSPVPRPCSGHRVRGPSVASCRCMRVISSPNGSIIAARQLRRHCWVEEDLVALPTHAGAERVMRGERRRRARGFHVCSRSRPCSRQENARVHVEEAAMGTLCTVEIRVPKRCTRSRPGGRSPARCERACA